MAKQVDKQLAAICKDIAGRQRYMRAPQKIADVMSGLLARRGYAQVKSNAECGDAWQQAVGGGLGDRSRAGQVRRGVLEVTVVNSAVLQELTFRKKQLLQRLQELVPNRKIRDLRFRVGAIS